MRMNLISSPHQFQREARNRRSVRGRLLSFFRLTPLLAALFLIGACQHYSPTHHSGSAWQVGQPLQQRTNTLDFHYTGYTESGESGVSGSATLRSGMVPGWVAYYEQAALLVFVTDQRGRILEQHRVPFPTGTPASEPLQFSVRLDSPIRLDDRSFYISFGYNLMFCEFDPGTGTSGRKLLRHEAGYK